ncbi:MAG: hypothetical protein JWO94_1488 [Verrucomicrobiaceae bacterium]|nr:hypothetical protein [Verrucomicrobiaceae bacterium]
MRELVYLLSEEIYIQTAYEFYESCQPGRGDVFMCGLDIALKHLSNFPEMGPVSHGSYRRLLLHKFRFGIFYTLEGRRIIISGIMDLRQAPGNIRRRLIPRRP